MREAPEIHYIPAILYIRDNATGKIRIIGEWFDSFVDGDFIWADGNYSCDCNRAMFFAWANGEEDPDRSCGDNAYSIRILAAEDGRELYEDEDWDAATPLT